jgi:hypothetical protein
MGIEQVTPGADQAQNQQALGWRAALPDEYKDHEFVKTFQKPGDFVKSSLEIKAERDSLKTRLDGAIPKLPENATDQQKAEFRKAFGVPDKPEGYELKALPADLKDLQPMTNWWSGVAHEIGLSKSQAQQTWDKYAELAIQSHKEDQERRETERAAGMDVLKKEWGTNYDKNVEIVSRAEKQFGMPKEWLEAHNAHNDPVLVRWTHKIGLAMLNDTIPQGTPPRGQSTQAGMQYKVPNPQGG